MDIERKDTLGMKMRLSRYVQTLLRYTILKKNIFVSKFSTQDFEREIDGLKTLKTKVESGFFVPSPANTPPNLSGGEKPENEDDHRPKVVLNGVKEPESEIYDLDSAEDGESSEEAHGASYQTKLGLQSDLLVLLNLVVGGRVEVDLDHVQRRELLLRS